VWIIPAVRKLDDLAFAQVRQLADGNEALHPIDKIGKMIRSNGHLRRLGKKSS